MNEPKIVLFCREHSNWKELLSVFPYSLSIKEHENYVLFKYNLFDSNFNEDIVREARGIILDKSKNFKVVCYGFNKFFNYGEPSAAAIDWESAFISEKIDGSNIRVWVDNGKVHYSTLGMIDLDNENGEKFKKIVEDLLSKEHKTINLLNYYNFTLIFELVSPETKVVIDYEKPDLYLIGIRNNSTMQEINIYASDLLPTFKRPKRYYFNSLDEIIEVCRNLSKDEEGYVVCDKYFNRIKIKSIEYLKAHYYNNNNAVSTKYILQIIEDQEQEEFLSYFPQYAEKINKIQEWLNHGFDEFCLPYLNEAREIYQNDGNRALFEYTRGLDINPSLREYILKKTRNEQKTPPFNVFFNTLNLPKKVSLFEGAPTNES